MNDNFKTTKPHFAFAASRIFGQAGGEVEAAIMDGVLGAEQLRDICDGAAVRIVELHQGGASEEELVRFARDAISEIQNAAGAWRGKYVEAA